MTTKTDKIYEIAETLGYDGPKGSRITDALDDLNSVVSGGGGGGGNVLVVNMEPGSGSQSGKMIANKTAKEICDAASAGALVFAILKAGPTTTQYQVAGAAHMDDTYSVSFTEVTYMNSAGYVLVAFLTLDGNAADGTVYTYTSYTLTSSS